MAKRAGLPLIGWLLLRLFTFPSRARLVCNTAPGISRSVALVISRKRQLLALRRTSADPRGPSSGDTKRIFLPLPGMSSCNALGGSAAMDFPEVLKSLLEYSLPWTGSLKQGIISLSLGRESGTARKEESRFACTSVRSSGRSGYLRWAVPLPEPSPEKRRGCAVVLSVTAGLCCACACLPRVEGGPVKFA